MTALRTLDEIWEQGARDALAHPPMSQAKADRIAAILAPHLARLHAPVPQAA